MDSCPFWEFNVLIKYNNSGQKNDSQLNNKRIALISPVLTLELTMTKKIVAKKWQNNRKVD